jgi:hypothetical protein
VSHFLRFSSASLSKSRRLLPFSSCSCHRRDHAWCAAEPSRMSQHYLRWYWSLVENPHLPLKFKTLQWYFGVFADSISLPSYATASFLLCQFHVSHFLRFSSAPLSKSRRMVPFSSCKPPSSFCTPPNSCFLFSFVSSFLFSFGSFLFLFFLVCFYVFPRLCFLLFFLLLYFLIVFIFPTLFFYPPLCFVLAFFFVVFTFLLIVSLLYVLKTWASLFP